MPSTLLDNFFHNLSTLPKLNNGKACKASTWSNANACSWSHKRTLAAQIELQIKQFEIVDNQACVLDVSWLIWPKDNNTAISHHAMITIPVNNQQYSALVNAHSQALVKLSKQIATSLSGVSQGFEE
jgi:uncharacterized lipoprotein YmbA